MCAPVTVSAAELPPLKLSVLLGSEMTLRKQQFFPAHPVEQRGAMRYTTASGLKLCGLSFLRCSANLSCGIHRSGRPPVFPAPQCKVAAWRFRLELRHLPDRQGSRIANNPLEISAAHGKNDAWHSKYATQQPSFRQRICLTGGPPKFQRSGTNLLQGIFSLQRGICRSDAPPVFQVSRLKRRQRAATLNCRI